MVECYLSWRSIAGLDDDLTDVDVMERRREIFRHTIEPLASLHEEGCDGGRGDNDELDDGQPAIFRPHRNGVMELFLALDQELVKRFRRHVSTGKKPCEAWSLAKVWASAFRCIWDQRTDPTARAIWDFPPEIFWTRGRCLVRTEGGLLGLCPKDTQVGDKIALLQGSVVPYVLRPVVGGHFTLVGECVAHDLMWG